MRIRNYFLLIAILPAVSLTTSSCDCNQNVKGVVLDKMTKKPIDSVLIHKIGNDWNEFSDSTGSFKIRAISGGLFGCPVMKIVLKKNGYDSVAEAIDNGSSKTIFLEKTHTHAGVGY